MGDIMVLCEHENGTIKKYSKELVYKASEIANGLGCVVHAVVFGEAARDDAQELGIYGAKKVLVVTGEPVTNFDADQYVSEAEKLIKVEKPSYVLASATAIGRDVMPRLAVRFDAGMATECIDFIVVGGDVAFRRPAYAGKVWIDIDVKGAIKFATARPNVFEIGETGCEKADVISIAASPIEKRVVLKERVQSEAKQIDLIEANVIISGGRAMGNAENYKILRELASLLNASIGASRAAVDAGYISHDHQVGQTGKTVNPTLYIACGISGAIQHLAGMRTSKIVVAINKDPDAPIFTKADFGIIGDLFKVVPAVTERLRKVLSQ